MDEDSLTGLLLSELYPQQDSPPVYGNEKNKQNWSLSSYYLFLLLSFPLSPFLFLQMTVVVLILKYHFSWYLERRHVTSVYTTMDPIL